MHSQQEGRHVAQCEQDPYSVSRGLGYVFGGDYSRVG